MSSKRMAYNTIASYGRSVAAVCLTLFSGRWVINSLGQSDFGLYSVVGSVIVIITFLNGVMSGSSSRFFAYAIGKESAGDIAKWFSASLSIHACLAVILLFVGWPIGEYIIRCILVVPSDRLDACVSVFHFSLVAAFVSMISVPFVAMFTAKQCIAEIAFWGVLQSLLTFGLAFSLLHVRGDRLVRYALGMSAIVVLIQLCQVARGLWRFDESRKFSLKGGGARFKKMISFSAWNLIGDTGVVFRDQGAAVLLNMFFGPKMNAAYGIATQVSWQTNQLSVAMIGAFSPEITASEGRGDRIRVHSLSNQSSKFGTLMILLFSAPLIVEMDYVLRLWLGRVPEYASVFCALILIRFLIDRMTTGFALALNASGKIAAYQATVGVCQILALPIAWWFLHVGFPPTSVGCAFVITITIVSIGRAFWAHRLLGVSLKTWLREVVFSCTLITLVALSIALILHCVMPESFFRLIVVCAGSALATIVGGVVALSEPERAYLDSLTGKLVARFKSVLIC